MSEFTGERVIPGQVNDDLWAEHISRYAFAARRAAGARVLDIGCGTGYGTAELAHSGLSAIGIDIAPEAVAYGCGHYGQSNLTFVSASATALPFADSSFDLVTGFEVIEHLTDWRGLLAEARRVLRPAGEFLVSTPSKSYYSESRGTEGPNPFHTHEFEFEEFQAVLAEFFPCVTVLLQNHVEAIAFYHEQDLPPADSRVDAMRDAACPVDARMDGVRGTAQDAHFFLAVCSMGVPAPSRGLLYVHQGSNLLRERERHIQSLERELVEARGQRDEMIRIDAELKCHLEEQNRWTLQMGEQVEEHRRWAAQLDQELNLARERLVELHKELEDRTAWAISLNERAQQLTQRVEIYDARWNMLRESRWIKLGRKMGVGPQIDPEGSTPGSGSGGGA